jgi:hypothetical protein
MIAAASSHNMAIMEALPASGATLAQLFCAFIFGYPWKASFALSIGKFSS